MTSGLSGRVAIVTGGASGIGAAIARTLAGEGAFVYAADFASGWGEGEAQGGARDRAAPTGANGAAGRIIALRLDVTDESQWETAVAAVLSAAGRLDVLVNGAGISFAEPIMETALADWRRVFAVNVEGVFLGTKHGMRAMTEGGSIVNVSSAAGIRAAAGASAYAASKAAVGMLTRVAAREGSQRQPAIRVNAVAPGGVRTPMWRTMPFFQALVAEHGSEEAAFAALEREEPDGRFASSEEIAGVVCFLLSDAAKQINGVVLAVDGGYST